MAIRPVQSRCGGRSCRWGAVRGPARVRDARGARKVGGLAAVGQDRDATGALHAMELSVGRQNLDACRVIAAVLKRCQPVQKELGRLLLASVSHDSAHVCPLAHKLRLVCARAPVWRTSPRVYQPRIMLRGPTGIDEEKPRRRTYVRQRGRQCFLLLERLQSLEDDGIGLLAQVILRSFGKHADQGLGSRGAH